ncbi:hypothetical protein ACWF9G_30155 [Nocardia sp. NPDC055029]
MKVASSEFLLAMALTVMTALCCGLVAGFLSWRGGANPSNAILRGLATFGAVLMAGVVVFGLGFDIESATAALQNNLYTG